MPQSAYIHIPFCQSKCKYCSFVSYPTCSKEIKKSYVDTLIKEIKFFYKKEPLKTLYFGGGTPSLVESDDIKRILNCFCYENMCEITIEINPETVDYSYLKQLKEVGINRISVGIQSFDNEILKAIGRIHTSEKAVETIKKAKETGFENISCDFIYGLPNQTKESFCNDLTKAVDLNIKHISLYGLKIEEGCYFYKHPPQNIANDDLQADMYLAAINLLTKNGFEHYEISNFCKPDFHSRHNLNYWSCGEYYGFGTAAHGYINNERHSNFCDLNTYANQYEKKETSHVLSKQEALEEAIFLGFRRGCGININEINQKFSIDFEKNYETVLKKFLQTGHIKKNHNGYSLSAEGYMLSNVILAEFL